MCLCDEASLPGPWSAPMRMERVAEETDGAAPNVSQVKNPEFLKRACQDISYMYRLLAGYLGFHDDHNRIELVKNVKVRLIASVITHPRQGTTLFAWSGVWVCEKKLCAKGVDRKM